MNSSRLPIVGGVVVTAGIITHIFEARVHAHDNEGAHIGRARLKAKSGAPLDGHKSTRDDASFVAVL